MIFVFEDDTTLSVLSILKDVQREYEGIDVEDGCYQFYDEQGVFLKPIFTKSNKRLFLNFIVLSGEYHLVPAPNEGKDILVCLQKTTAINPNQWFQNLDEVKQYLERNRKNYENNRS